MSSSNCRRMVSLCFSVLCASRSSFLFSRVTSLRSSPRSPAQQFDRLPAGSSLAPGPGDAGESAAGAWACHRGRGRYDRDKLYGRQPPSSVTHDAADGYR